MDFKDYKVKDFLVDERFKSWVLNPTAKENQYWRQWIEANPDKKKLLQEAREIILRLRFQKKTPAEYQYEKVLSNILLADREGGNNKKEPEGGLHLSYPRHEVCKRRSYTFYYFAASIAFMAAFVMLYTMSDSDEIPLEAEEVPIITKSNPKGQKSTFALPDGSIVTLNAESSLQFPEKFDTTSREVTLTGEAFFEVAKEPERKFTVKSKNILTTALGTSFNVRAYPEEQEIQVALASGKVQVNEYNIENENAVKENIILSPGEKLVHHKEEGHSKKVKFNQLNELGWKDGILIFNDVDLPYFINTLERWYGVSFSVIGEKKDTWHIYGHFERKTLRETLKGLSFTYNIKYELTGKNVTLYL